MVSYKVAGYEIEIAIPRDMIGFTGTNISFNYQIFDNPAALNNIEDNFVHGESAPDRRFNYPVSISSPYGVVITSITGKDVDEPAFSIYPNPASHVFTIQASSVINSVNIKNASGVTVYQNNLSTKHLEIDISKFEPGLYNVATKFGIHKLIVN